MASFNVLTIPVNNSVDMIKRQNDFVLYRSKTKNREKLRTMSLSSPFSIEDLHCLKLFKSHMTKIWD